MVPSPMLIPPISVQLQSSRIRKIPHISYIDSNDSIFRPYALTTSIPRLFFGQAESASEEAELKSASPIALGMPSRETTRSAPPTLIASRGIPKTTQLFSS